MGFESFIVLGESENTVLFILHLENELNDIYVEDVIFEFLRWTADA